MTTELAALWSELEQLATVGGVTARRFLANAPVDVFVGIENPGCTRLVFIEAPVSVFTDAVREWPQSAGFTVTVEDGAKRARGRVVVRLAVAGYRDVFSVLVADLLRCLAAAKTGHEAVYIFVARLERWQRLLALHGPEGLSSAEQRGLYGELIFLRDVLLPSLGAVRALAAWTGPLAKDQDFQLPRCSVEVKVSTGNPDHQVHVSNVRQLDETASPSGTLYLFHASLEERRDQGETLVAIINSMRQELGPSVGTFDELLNEVGYLPVHEARYAHTGYVVKARRVYSVRQGFPRILEADLRPGVGEVRYAIQLGACTPFETPETVMRDLIRETT